jgi:hypothetical protein
VAGNYTSHVICCSFIFEPGEYDHEFRVLDEDIERFATALPGFVKRERWESGDGVFVNAAYFFSDRDSIAQLAAYPQHQTAKANYSRWYRSYRVDIMEVSATYGSTPAPAL